MDAQSSLRKKADLSREFCVVAGEFSDLQCQMKTLIAILSFRFFGYTKT